LTRSPSDGYWWDSMRYFLGVYCLALTLLGCSDNQNDIGSGHKPDSGGATGGAAGAGGNGNVSNGGGSTGGTNSGGASSGGAATGGASTGGGSTGGASTGGTSAGATGGAVGVGGSAGGNDSGTTDAATDDAGLCGNTACSPTRCAGIDCGPAVCCQGDTGPACLHGVSQCPPSFTRKSMQCWSGGGPGSAALLASCRTAADCFVAKHYTGCCRVQAIGLHVSEFSRFQAFETSCGGIPPCGCCCDTIFAEGGGSGSANTAIAVDCVAGACQTTLP